MFTPAQLAGMISVCVSGEDNISTLIYLLINYFNIQWEQTENIDAMLTSPPFFFFPYKVVYCNGEGNGNPLQCSCLGSLMDRGAWWAAVHGVSRSWTGPGDFTFTFHFHALEKEMVAHSSVLAWRIPGMGEPGGLPSMGSHRVGHDWSDLAAAAEAAVSCKNCSGFLCTTFEVLPYIRTVKFPGINHKCYVLTLLRKHHNFLKDLQLG